MARDVEFNVTASDKTGPGLSSVERRVKATTNKVSKDNSSILTKGLKDIGSSFTGLASKIAPELTANLTKTVASAGEAAGPVLVAAIAGSLPLLGSLTAAAIIGGAGIGGVIGGILLVKDDARVAAAGKQIGESLLGSLRNDASSFIQPVLSSIDLIQTRFNEVEGNIKSIFSNASSFVRPLTDGITRAVQSITRGLDKAIGGAGPVIAVIADGIARVGGAIGDVFDELGDNGVEAGVALKLVFDVLVTSIQAVGLVVNALIEAFGFLLRTFDKLRLLHGPAKQLYDDLNNIKTGTDGTTDAFNLTAGATDLLATSVSTVKPDVDAMAESLKDASHQASSLYGATTDAATAAANLSQAIKDNGKTLDIHTEKGRNNRTAVANLASALNAQYQASLDLNGEGPQTDAVLASNQAQFEKLAGKLGLSASAAHRLAGEVGLIPSNKNVTITADTKDANTKIFNVNQGLAGLHNKTITVDINTVGAGAAIKALSGHLGTRGDFAADGSYQFAAGSTGTSRSAPPTPINVNNTVDVFLDGSPFRTLVRTQTEDQERRVNYRNRVGAR